jgi:cation transport ATPase
MSEMKDNNMAENQNITTETQETENEILETAATEAVEEEVEKKAASLIDDEEEDVLKTAVVKEVSPKKEKKSKKRKDDEEEVYHKPLIKRRKPNRSIAGDIFLYLFLLLVAVVMFFPIVYAVESALKPLDELYKFPPRIFAQNPTLDNFSDLFVTMSKSWVSFSRYLFNTVFITGVGTGGHLIAASMAAFVLAKYDFPGGKTFFKLVTVAMMFTGYLLGNNHSRVCISYGTLPYEAVHGRSSHFTYRSSKD